MLMTDSLGQWIGFVSVSICVSIGLNLVTNLCMVGGSPQFLPYIFLLFLLTQSLKYAAPSYIPLPFLFFFFLS